MRNQKVTARVRPRGNGPTKNWIVTFNPCNGHFNTRAFKNPDDAHEYIANCFSQLVKSRRKNYGY